MDELKPMDKVRYKDDLSLGVGRVIEVRWEERGDGTVAMTISADFQVSDPGMFGFYVTHIGPPEDFERVEEEE